MPHAAAGMATQDVDAGFYQRHRPEQTLLYQFVDESMRQWVLGFSFQLRFLFVSRPEIMGRALGMGYRVIARHLIKRAGRAYSYNGPYRCGHPDPALRG